MIGEKPLISNKDRKRIEAIRLKMAAGDNPYDHIGEQKTEYTRRQRVEVPTAPAPDRNWFDNRPTKDVIVTKPAEYADGKKPPSCIKCDAEVRPGFCHTGKVLEGFIKIVVEKAVFDKVLLESTSKIVRIPVTKYVRGFICDDCAAEYRQYRYDDGNGTVTEVPIVIVDPIQSIPPKDEREGFKSGKGFNTRITTG